MTIEQKLMKNLMRASASTRRHPQKDGGTPPARGRGFGHILDLLSESEGISQQQIADTLGIRPQSVSEAISVLESRGLVCKIASQQDKRITLIRITEQGIIHRKEMAEERKARAIKLFSPLTEEEKVQLLHLLEKTNRAFSDSKENL